MSEVAHPHGPTFQWRDARRPKRVRLFFFIFLSAFVHIGFFYLFRVVSGVRETPVPRPETITLLHSSDPLAARLIERLIDRSTATTGNLRSAESHTLQLSEFAPTYTPSYAGYEPPLRPFPEPDRTRPLPKIYNSGVPALPPVVPPKAPPVSAAPPVQTAPLTLELSPELQSRAPSEPLESLDALVPPGTHRTFSIALSPTGHVTHLLAIPGPTASLPPSEDLLFAIRSLRFTTAPSPTAGTLTINR